MHPTPGPETPPSPAQQVSSVSPFPQTGLARPAMVCHGGKHDTVLPVCQSARFRMACLSFHLMLRWFEHHQVYHPSRVMYATGAELGRPFEDVNLVASDGIRLNGWFFPAPPDAAGRAPAVLFCHGNGGNISHRLEMAETLLSMGVAVLLFDYRGYGRSEGRPSEQGTYLDGEAAYRWLLQKGFDAPEVLVFGESLGGGVAADLASRLPVGGLILQSTFTRIADIGAELFPWLPVRWLAGIKYDTLSKLNRITAPVLVMHSRDDRLVRFNHGETNFAAANHPKLFCELSGDHNHPLTNRSQFISGFEKFLAMVKQARTPPVDAGR